MNWFKKIFKKEVQEEVIVSNKKNRVCNSCGMKITSDQKRTKQMGLDFHRHCWKKERKASGY